MSESLRILTYNTQLRSWAMETGLPPSLPPVDTAEKRAELIGDAIVNSPFDYDLVGLCEVFDEDARKVLRGKLRGRFPFQLTKADYDHVRVENGIGSTENLGLLALWQLVGLPEETESSYRLEDSGLMLFSRWPFAMMSSAGLDPATRALLQLSGFPVPPTLPVVDFLPFVDNAGDDSHACKGVAYVRVRRNGSQIYHLFFSHTQADEKRLEEQALSRSKQFAIIEKFIESCIGGAPFGEEVFFMGDLNVRGEQTALADPAREWKSYFETPNRLLNDGMIDVWGRRQCTGAPGLRDPGFTAGVRYAPMEQRLDYILVSASSRLSAQHQMIDYDLAQVPPGIEEVSYLSDHKPLRLELARPRLNSTPDTAFAVAFPPFPSLPLFTDDDYLIEGQVKWYRFDEPGTYDFNLIQHGRACHFEVYLDTDLSRPRQQYRTEERPEFGPKYVLASAPFLVKVSPDSREGELTYSFRALRHLGRGPEDAIQLPYGTPLVEAFPGGGQVMGQDHPSTPWEDGDVKWFRLDGPTVDLPRPLEATIVLDTDGGADCAIALARNDGGQWDLLDRQGPGETHYEIHANLRMGEQVYVQVQRVGGMTPPDLTVTITARTNLSLLLGGKRGAPWLLCEEETSGWGADDIELGIVVDGRELIYINNDAIGDFEQDSLRDLNQWIPDCVPYFDGIEFRVVEKDDIGHDDIGRETLRPRAALDAWAGFIVEKPDADGTLRGVMRVAVDDGTYALHVAVTTWDEQF